MDLEQLAALRDAPRKLYEGGKPPPIASARGRAVTEAVITFLAACHEMALEDGGNPILIETTRIALNALREAQTPREVAKALDLAWELSKLIDCGSRPK